MYLERIPYKAVRKIECLYYIYEEEIVNLNVRLCKNVSSKINSLDR